MIAIDTALRFAAAWLAVGLGLFIAGNSVGALRGAATLVGRGSTGLLRRASILYVIPFFLGIVLMVAGTIAVVRVVPW